MELRVWVDGAPRVVCGVTADTTCQDVVIALAQAIGQTGRFALMETWQDVERPLAPKERPLDVISRRGLRAGESSFILRRTGLQIDSSSSAAWFGHSAGEIVGHPLQRRSLPTKALISKAEREAKDQGEVVRRIRCRAQTLTGGVPIFLQALSSTTSGCKTLVLQEEKLVGQKKSACNLGCSEERTGQGTAKNCDLRHARVQIATPLYCNEKIKDDATKTVEGCVGSQSQDGVEKSLLVLEQEREMFDIYKNTSFRSFYYQNCQHYGEPEKDAMDLNIEDVGIKWIQDTKCISSRDDVNFFETTASIGDSLEFYKNQELKSGIILKMKRVCGFGSVPQNEGKMKIGLPEDEDNNCTDAHEKAKGAEEERELKRLADLEEEEDFWHNELLMEERRGEGLGARLLALRAGLNACETKLLASEEQLLSLMKCVQHAQVTGEMEGEDRDIKPHDLSCFMEKNTVLSPAANHQGSTSSVCLDGDGLSTFPEGEEVCPLNRQRVPPTPEPNEHQNASNSNSHCTLPLSLSMTDRWHSSLHGPFSPSLLKEDLRPLSTSETSPVLGTEEKTNTEDASDGCDRLPPLDLCENNSIRPLDGQCRVDGREQILAYWKENERMNMEEESEDICAEEEIEESSEKEEGRMLRRQLADALNEATRLDQEHQKVDGALLHAAHIAKERGACWEALCRELRRLHLQEFIRHTGSRVSVLPPHPEPKPVAVAPPRHMSRSPRPTTPSPSRPLPSNPRALQNVGGAEGIYV